MTHSPHTVNYSPYFKHKQKVYFVNTSPDRNHIFESLCGIVTFSNMDTLELLINYNGHDLHGGEVGKATFKLTSEALGNGIQIQAELIDISFDGNILKFRMYGILEMFQRRIASRVVLSVPILQQRGNFPLSFFKSKWNQITDNLNKFGAPKKHAMKEAEIDLSVEGIGISLDENIQQTQISLFFIALDANLPICAITETIWEKGIEGQLRCGFRFIHILKRDQDHIDNRIKELITKNGGNYVDYRRNWALVDKMIAEDSKPAS